MDHAATITAYFAGVAVVIGAIAAAYSKIMTEIRINRAATREAQKSIDHNTTITAETKKEVASQLAENKQEAKDEARQVAANAANAAEVAQGVAKAINGRMDQQLEDTRKASYAEGLLAGQALAEANAAIIKSHEEQIRMNTERITRHARNNEEHLRLLREDVAKLIAAQPMIIKQAIVDATK